MAKIRLVTVMALDGFLPDEGNPLMQWLDTDRRGFRYWRERSTFSLPAGYPMIDLINRKGRTEGSRVYLAEISDAARVELLRALKVYDLVDEWIIYSLPHTQGTGVRLTDGFTAAQWELKKSRTFRNGICCRVYVRQ